MNTTHGEGNQQPSGLRGDPVAGGTPTAGTRDLQSSSPDPIPLLRHPSERQTPEFLEVVVNGQPVRVQAGAVRSVIEQAIALSGQIGAPVEQWQLRTRDGDIIPHTLSDGGEWMLTGGTLLFLNLGLPLATAASHKLGPIIVTTRCRVCEHATHAKWHDVAKGSINPVALLQLLDRLNDNGTGVVEAVRGWVVIMAGLDVAAMRTMLESEQGGLREDPVAPRAVTAPHAHESSSADVSSTRARPPREEQAPTIVAGYDATFWHESYTMLRDAITTHLDDCIRDDDVAEECILVEAIETAGKRLAAPSSGGTVPSSPLQKGNYLKHTPRSCAKASNLATSRQ